MVYRSEKGSRLTTEEMDGNFAELDRRLYRSPVLPSASDDITRGFNVGDEWKVLTPGFPPPNYMTTTYECLSNAEGSAVWELKKSGLFESSASLIYPASTDIKKSWIVGSDEMDYNSAKFNKSRAFFDYAKSAFRAGYCSNSSWDTDNVGSYSVAMGNNNTASGYYSVAMGRNNIASNYYSVAMGTGNIAENEGELAYGANYEDKNMSSLNSLSYFTYDDSVGSLCYMIHTAGGSSGVEFFEYTLVANKDDDTEKWVRKGEFLVTRTATTCTISHHTGTDIIKDVAAWDMQIVVDGADFSFDVTGEAGKTIGWTLNLKKTMSHRSA